MTDTEKAALCARIDELCSGNQRLLEEVMSLEAALEGMHIINDRYRADHAKLTNLAKQMYPYAKAHLQLGVALGRNDTLSYDWALQMVDLGIEVPS